MGVIVEGNFEVEILKHSRNPLGLEAITFRWTYERMIPGESAPDVDVDAILGRYGDRDYLVPA